MVAGLLCTLFIIGVNVFGAFIFLKACVDALCASSTANMQVFAGKFLCALYKFSVFHLCWLKEKKIFSCSFFGGWGRGGMISGLIVFPFGLVDFCIYWPGGTVQNVQTSASRVKPLLDIMSVERMLTLTVCIDRRRHSEDWMMPCSPSSCPTGASSCRPPPWAPWRRCWSTCAAPRSRWVPARGLHGRRHVCGNSAKLH